MAVSVEEHPARGRLCLASDGELCPERCASGEGCADAGVYGLAGWAE